MFKWMALHLDHDDYDRSQYRGQGWQALSHAYCNIAASNRSPRRRRIPAAWPSARQW